MFNLKTRIFNCKEVILFSLSVYVAFHLFVYGGAKLFGLQFGSIKDFSDSVIKDMSGSQLTWSFFAYSFYYSFIIGVFQVTGAVLLLVPKTRLIGALLLTPVLINIILIDIFYQINTGALINAIIYFSFLISIFIIEKERLYHVFAILTSTKVKFKYAGRALFLKGGLVLCGLLLIKLIHIGVNYVVFNSFSF